MLFTRGRLTPGQTILVQGSSGGVATALIRLAASAGIRVWVTGRTEEKRALALSLGADAAFEPGRAPARAGRRRDGDRRRRHLVALGRSRSSRAA